MTTFKHFDSNTAVLSYIASEIVDTLQNDYDRMTHQEREHYSNEDRKTMRNKLHDVTRTAPLIHAIPDLLALLTEFTADIHAVGLKETQKDWPDLASTCKRATTLLRSLRTGQPRTTPTTPHPSLTLMRDTLRTIAEMKTEEECGEDIPPSEDWISTLSDVIINARTALKQEGRRQASPPSRH